MRIDRLEIFNFRGISNGSVCFSDRTILIGDNNAGKTTILEAIALLLGRDRMVRALSEHDFYGSDPGPTDRVRLIATLTGFESNEPENHVDWFRAGRGTPKWIRARDSEIIPAPETKDDLLAVQIALDARFDALSLEVETVRYFYDSTETGDTFDEESVTPLPGHLIRELGFFLVPANRSWDRMISFGSELFRRVINYMSGKPSATVRKLRDEVRTPDPEPQDDENIKKVVEEINDDLSDLLGKSADLKLRLTQADSPAILNALEPHFRTDTGYTLPASRHGAGLISLQSLILLLRFGHQRAENGDPFILAIEEPELHVPPPMQRRIAQKIHSLTSQSILTTHSPIVASHAKATELVLVRNAGGQLSSARLSKSPLTKESNAVERAIFQTGLADTVTALMHSHLLIPEGRIDRDYLEIMGRHMTAADADGLAESTFGTQIGILPTKDGNVRTSFLKLKDIHGSITCLVDGDAGGDTHLQTLLQDPEPTMIIQWPVSWTIEHVMGWVLDSDPTTLEDPALIAMGIPLEISELVTLLSTNTNQGGMKGDLVVIETLIAIAGQSASCRARMKIILDSILYAAVGGGAQTEHLVEHHQYPDDSGKVWRFVP